MTDRVSQSYIADNSRTEGEMKQALKDVIGAFGEEHLGGLPETELTISSGSVTPDRASHTVDTESDAASDDLDTIKLDNHPDGRMLLIRPQNSSRTVVVRHGQGGDGQILTADGNNLTLDDTSKALWLQRRGTDWEEVLRTTEAPVTTRNLTSATTLDDSDHGKTITLDASSSAFTVTLPAHQDGFRVTFVLTDATNDVTIEDSGAVTVTTLTDQGQSPTLVSDGSNWRIVGRTTEELVKPGTSTDPGLAFDTWRTPNADRPTKVVVRAGAETDGTTNGDIRVDVDDSGGTTRDYSPFQVRIGSSANAGTSIFAVGEFTVRAGASYRIANISDPNNTNALFDHREFPL